MWCSSGDKRGFTIGEVMVSISLIGVIVVIFSIFFSSNYRGYLELQKSTIQFNELSNGLQRTARVIRGIYIIEDAEPYRLTGYTYFAPNDNVLSKVDYYYDQSDHSLRVDVIPASGSPPNYTYNNADLRTARIVTNVDNSAPIFTYKSLDGEIEDLNPDLYKDITLIGLHFNTQDQIVAGDGLKTQVSLRNRKVNL